MNQHSQELPQYLSLEGKKINVMPMQQEDMCPSRFRKVRIKNWVRIGRLVWPKSSVLKSRGDQVGWGLIMQGF